MNITVLLCTFNRCEQLGNALESLASSILPDSVAWEVLVVDNNSTDRTRDVVQSFCCRYEGRFRYLFEPTPGKSHALNAGIRDSRGEIIAFVDDDVTVEPAWLHNLTACFEVPAWSGSSGRTRPANPVSLPRWFTITGPYSLGGAVAALFDLGDQAGELREPPFGANMAFRKSSFKKYGGFRTDLGPSPANQIRNEDTEFGRRLLAAGERLFYAPSAVVYHPLSEKRLSKKFILSWFYDLGRAYVREIGPRPDLWGIRRPYLTLLKAVIITLPRRTLQWMFACAPAHRFYRKAWVWEAMGEIEEIYKRWLAKDAPPQTDVLPIV